MDVIKKVRELKVQKELLGTQVESLKATVQKLREEKKVCDEGLNIVQRVALLTQEQLRYNLEDIVNTMLKAVYGDTYTFSIIYDTKYNRTEARMALIEDGEELDVLSSVGGGVVDLLTIALRVALVILSSNRQTLIFDEPGKMLSEDIRPAFYEALKSLSKDLGIQIIMVSHDPHALMNADKQIRIVKVGGESYVR